MKLAKILLEFKRRFKLWRTPFRKRLCTSCCLFCKYFDNHKLGNCYEELFGKRWDE